MRQPNQNDQPTKPLLRGWFHALGAVASAIFTVVLVIASAIDTPRMIALLVFGLSMVQLYTVSAIYHIGQWQDRARRVLRSLDHSSIFVLIAGTYTPLCAVALQGWQRVAVLVSVWALAISGVFLSAFKPSLPRWVGTSLYIGMGWISLGMLPAFWDAFSVAAVAAMALGGLLYTVGGIIYALKRPNPFPSVFGFHEVFHLFVMAGSATFAAVVWVCALPGALA